MRWWGVDGDRGGGEMTKQEDEKGNEEELVILDHSYHGRWVLTN